MSPSRPTTASDKREYEAWLELCAQVRAATGSAACETAEQKEERLQKMLQPAQFEAFCRYYFPHYIDSRFGWFHREAARHLTRNDDLFLVLEWAREHAKSVFANVFVPLWLLANEKLTGMILASETEHKAHVLLGDLEAELRHNRLWSRDFGDAHLRGSFRDGHYTTADGIGFWAFGIGQNPAGVRKGANRPNYGVIDDASTKKKAKNQVLVKQDLDWCLGEFMGCMKITASRFVFANNRTAKNDLTAHIVGDVEPGDKKRDGITHLKVFATEDPATHAMLLPANGGVPAWKERYTVAQLEKRHQKMGYRNGMRQFYHQHLEDGNVFLPEQLPWVKCRPLADYEALISYNDPSFKSTKKNDFKAIVLVGKAGKAYHVLWAWVRQARVGAMVSAHYDLDEEVARGAGELEAAGARWREVICPHYMEANFMQDLLLEEYEREGEARGKMMRIRPDKRVKPDKAGRIENLSPLAERGYLGFNEKYRKSTDMLTLRDQFLAFPNGHDDGPDAVEGAIYLLNTRHKTRTGNHRRSGKYQKMNQRSA